MIVIPFFAEAKPRAMLVSLNMQGLISLILVKRVAKKDGRLHASYYGFYIILVVVRHTSYNTWSGTLS